MNQPTLNFDSAVSDDQTDLPPFVFSPDRHEWQTFEQDNAWFVVARDRLTEAILQLRIGVLDSEADARWEAHLLNEQV